MIHASLFSGIDGPAVAADAMGWETVFHCEIEPFGQMVLKDKWPNAELYENIKHTDFTIWRGKIDVLTGGFPCQPYSAAGKRKGPEDNRHLWPEMLRAIREIKPRWVIPENVSGLISWNGGLVFNEVQTQLENEGYEVLPVLLPAACVGAPHYRYRVFYVAHANSQRWHEWGAAGNGKKKEKAKWPELHEQTDRFGQKSNAANAQRVRGLQDNGKGNPKQHNKNSEGNYWRNFPTQSPVCSGNDGLPIRSLRQRICADSMGLLSEKEIDTILSKAASKWRKETIKAAGNAIVPQVMMQQFKAIQQYENLLNDE